MPRFAANISLLFTELPFLERFEAAAKAGFTAVEILFPYDEEPEKIRAALDAHGLAMALFNAPPGDFEAGDRGMAAVPGREAEFAAALEEALRYAEIIRPERLHVMAGIADGRAARETFVANLKKASAMAPDQVFTIEPINQGQIPGYHLSYTPYARNLINAVGKDNLTLQLDLYHTQIMEGNLTRKIEALAPVIGHVQIAGVPDRHEPGRGELNVSHLMATLDRVGYEGWVGCEYHPAGKTEHGLGWVKPWLQKPEVKGENNAKAGKRRGKKPS